MAASHGQQSTSEEAAPPGWYPDPEGRRGVERFWDGKTWGPTRDAPLTGGSWVSARWRQTRGRILGGLALALVLAVVRGQFGGGLEESMNRTTTPTTAPRFSDRQCFAAALDLLELVHAEAEAPQLGEWSPSADANPLVAADRRANEVCWEADAEGFDWRIVHEDYQAVRDHYLRGDPMPTIDQLTPLDEVESLLG